MPPHQENHDNPGIFVRIFGQDDYEVLWLDGHGVIEKARNEESASGDTITNYLQERHVDSYVREMYTPWGEFEGVSVLRRLTLYESVHYLGRNAKVCAFLRPKVQALRFLEGLEKSSKPTAQDTAAEIRLLLTRFDDSPQTKMSKEALHRMMEEQLLNITTDLASVIQNPEPSGAVGK